MKLSHFEFELPEELLAQYPTDHRDESRLMVLNRKEGTIEHKLFKDVINYFDEGDVIMLNNTKVFPARMFGNKEKTGARIEVFLLRELNAEETRQVVALGCVNVFLELLVAQLERRHQLCLASHDVRCGLCSPCIELRR